MVECRPVRERSIAARAALAVALMVGFYGLALAVAFGLAWIPYAEWRYAERLHPKIAFFCLAGAFVILRAIVPRRDRFEPPGPALVAAQQPRLFAELRKVAEATSQAMPAEVYLAPDVNAWVSQRGGVMGVGSRRVMGLGLPLLQVLSVSQLRAVLAHEFGHYHGGDVTIGPWIYKTRQALVRTLQGLAGHSGLLSKPFELYATLFFRVSHAVSRHQELLADGLAARVAGAAALAGGLKAVHAAGLAFAPYWTQEVSPVLSAGFLPPLAGGFARFIEQPRIAEGLRQAVDEEARAGRHDPYDTHPSLRERLAALAQAPSRAALVDEAPALSLLEDVARLEQRLLAGLADRQTVQGLTPVTWDEVGARVLLPQWEGFLREHAFALSGVTPGGLAALDWAAIARKVARSAKREDAGESADDWLRLADYAVGAGVGLALARAGFAVDAPPGSPITLVRQGTRVEPFTLRQRLGLPDEREAWATLCAAAGIAELDLGRIALDKVRG
jgi:Zn-dependent protease with chaperone function